MGLHSVTWRVNTSALDNMDLVEDSLKCISGENSIINKTKDKSFHGAQQYSITAQIKKKKESIISLKKLGDEILKKILEDGIENRVDDSKYLHVRLELDKLVSGEICLANKNTTSATVKGRFKIESYPGDSIIEVISNLIETLIEDD